MTDGSRGAFVHVGPPKTGTTYLQSVLWNNRKRLRRNRVLLPGGAKVEHFRAAKDLKRLNRRRTRFLGSWMFQNAFP